MSQLSKDPVNSVLKSERFVMWANREIGSSCLCRQVNKGQTNRLLAGEHSSTPASYTNLALKAWL